MMRWSIPVAVLLCACTAAPPSDMPDTTPADPEVLMEADRAFNDAVAEGGSEAWALWFAEDGSMIQEGVGEIRGRARILAAMGALDQPGVELTWSPLRAQIAAGGDLGWTTGEFHSTFTAPDGTVTEARGRYVSIWRQQTDGSWKVVMDLGNPVGDAGGA